MDAIVTEVMDRTLRHLQWVNNAATAVGYLTPLVAAVGQPASATDVVVVPWTNAIRVDEPDEYELAKP